MTQENPRIREEIEAAKVFAKNKINEDISNGHYKHVFRSYENKEHAFLRLAKALDELVAATPDLRSLHRTSEEYVIQTLK